MKILFSGGGTLGPVTPLIAIIEELRSRDGGADAHEFFWIATERGAEIPLIKKAGIELRTIPSGKLRRYLSMKNFTDIRNIFKGFFAARAILKEWKPDVVVTAGGFVSVPVHYAAWTLGIPGVVHQQDIEIGLSNKLMSWVARRITVSVREQLTSFSDRKAVYTGNPVRPSVLQGSRERAIEQFRLRPDLATVFIFGGGTGAESLNRIAADVARECDGLLQIIHVTGMNRSQPRVEERELTTYHPYPFFTGEMGNAYAAADIVVARAGFNSVTEISAWGKTAILVPLTGHQERNAKWVEKKGAAVVLDELTLTSEELLQTIRELLNNEERSLALAQAAQDLFPADARERVTDEVLKFVKS